MTTALDLEQLLGDMLRLGTIASVDHASATCRVTTGEITTGSLPWLAARAGGVTVWSPPTVGEQCLLLCPEGDTLAGLVLVGLFSNSFPAPSSDPELVLLQLPDGATLSYHHGTHRLEALLPSGGTAHVQADGGLTIVGDVTITGNVSIEGNATASGTVTGQANVMGGGISLKGHKHSGVAAGTAKTGGPE
ncbi:MAG TPA: phage baseplate assembly protein V [Pedomonas sp.]